MLPHSDICAQVSSKELSYLNNGGLKHFFNVSTNIYNASRKWVMVQEILWWIRNPY